MKADSTQKAPRASPSQQPGKTTQQTTQSMAKPAAATTSLKTKVAKQQANQVKGVSPSPAAQATGKQPAPTMSNESLKASTQGANVAGTSSNKPDKTFKIRSGASNGPMIEPEQPQRRQDLAMASNKPTIAAINEKKGDPQPQQQTERVSSLGEAKSACEFKSVTKEFNRQNNLSTTAQLGGESSSSGAQKHKPIKYTYFLPVKVGPDGQLELPASITNQLKFQASNQTQQQQQYQPQKIAAQQQTVVSAAMQPQPQSVRFDQQPQESTVQQPQQPLIQTKPVSNKAAPMQPPTEYHKSPSQSIAPGGTSLGLPDGQTMSNQGQQDSQQSDGIVYVENLNIYQVQVQSHNSKVGVQRRDRMAQLRREQMYNLHKPNKIQTRADERQNMQRQYYQTLSQTQGYIKDQIQRSENASESHGSETPTSAINNTNVAEMCSPQEMMAMPDHNNGLISMPSCHFEDTLDDNEMPDFLDNICEYCITIKVLKYPPKRPLSPFIFFSQEQRKVLKMIHPQWSTKQVMKHLQKTWRNMNESQTKRYRDTSETDRARYDKQRRLLKEGLKPDQVCTCPLKSVHSADSAEPDEQLHSQLQTPEQQHISPERSDIVQFQQPDQILAEKDKTETQAILARMQAASSANQPVYRQEQSFVHQTIQPQVRMQIGYSNSLDFGDRDSSSQQQYSQPNVYYHQGGLRVTGHQGQQSQTSMGGCESTVMNKFKPQRRTTHPQKGNQVGGHQKPQGQSVVLQQQSQAVGSQQSVSSQGGVLSQSMQQHIMSQQSQMNVAATYAHQQVTGQGENEDGNLYAFDPPNEDVFSSQNNGINGLMMQPITGGQGSEPNMSQKNYYHHREGNSQEINNLTTPVNLTNGSHYFQKNPIGFSQENFGHDNELNSEINTEHQPISISYNEESALNNHNHRSDRSNQKPREPEPEAHEQGAYVQEAFIQELLATQSRQNKSQDTETMAVNFINHNPHSQAYYQNASSMQQPQQQQQKRQS